MRTKITRIVLLAGLVVGGVFAYWYWTQTPTYSLQQIQEAIETHDVVKFETYVDVESVSSRLVDDMTSYAVKEAETKKGAESFAAALGAGLVQLMKPRLVDAMHEQMLRYVEEGGFENSAHPARPNKSTDVKVKNLSKEIGASEETFQGIKYVRKQGKIAFVGLEFADERRGDRLILELKMRDMGDYWQVVEFSNLDNILQQVMPSNFRPSSSQVTRQDYTLEEKAEARRYWKVTIPRLINVGLIDRYTTKEDVLVVYVNGQMWRRRPPDTQEAFLSTVARSNRILGRTPHVQVRDRHSGQLYAEKTISTGP